MPSERQPWMPALHSHVGRGYSLFSTTDSDHDNANVILEEAGDCETLEDLRSKWKLNPITLQSFTQPASPVAPQRTCSPIQTLMQIPQLVWESGSACVHVAAIIFSISSLCVKLTANRIPAFEIVLVRSILCVAATVTTAVSRGLHPIFGQRKNYLMLALRGLVGTTAMTTMYFAVDSLPLPDAVTIFFTNPAVTAVFAWVMLGEQFGWKAAAGCVLSLTGVLLVSRPPFLFGHGEHYGATQIFGVIMAVVSSGFSALAFICVRIIGKKEPALKLALWFHSASFVTSVVPLMFGWPEKAVVPNLFDTGLMVLVGFTSFGGQLLINRGFQLEQAAKASSINLMQVLYSYVFGLTIFGDHVTLLGGLGSLMVSGGVLVINLRGGAAKPASGSKTEATATADEETLHMLSQPATALPADGCSCMEMVSPTPAVVQFFRTGGSEPCIPASCGVDDAPELPDSGTEEEEEIREEEGSGRQQERKGEEMRSAGQEEEHREEQSAGQEEGRVDEPDVATVQLPVDTVDARK